MDLLDIGGGFPGSDDAELQFEEVWFFYEESCCFFAIIIFSTLWLILNNPFNPFVPH